MERKNLTVTHEDMQLVDGKVVITSEELAKAIQDYEVDLNAEEEADLFGITLNFYCPQKDTKE